MGTGAAIFKGSRFYQTDYRSESYKRPRRRRASRPRCGDSKATGNGEAKTGAKEPAKASPRGGQGRTQAGKGERGKKPGKAAAKMNARAVGRRGREGRGLATSGQVREPFTNGVLQVVTAVRTLAGACGACRQDAMGVGCNGRARGA